MEGLSHDQTRHHPNRGSDLRHAPRAERDCQRHGRGEREGNHRMKNPESLAVKFRGVTLALIFGVVVAIGAFLWVAVSSVGGAFAELGRDLKLIMKGKG